MSTQSNLPYNSNGPKIRYGLFGISIILYLITILLTGLLPGFGIMSIIDLSILAFIGIIMVVYYPPSIWFSWKNKKTRFDQAGGEVAVGVFITTAWLAAAIFHTMFTAMEFCSDTDSGWYTGIKGCQASAIVLTVLYFINLIIHFGWTTWIIVLVHKNAKGPFERAMVYMLPTHDLVKGKFIVDNLKNGNGNDGEDTGLYNHRL